MPKEISAVDSLVPGFFGLHEIHLGSAASVHLSCQATEHFFLECHNKNLQDSRDGASIGQLIPVEREASQPYEHPQQHLQCTQGEADVQPHEEH